MTSIIDSRKGDRASRTQSAIDQIRNSPVNKTKKSADPDNQLAEESLSTTAQSESSLPPDGMINDCNIMKENIDKLREDQRDWGKAVKKLSEHRDKMRARAKDDGQTQNPLFNNSRRPPPTGTVHKGVDIPTRSSDKPNGLRSGFSY